MKEKWKKKKKKKKQKKKQKENDRKKQAVTDTIVKEWELNDFVLHLR